MAEKPANYRIITSEPLPIVPDRFASQPILRFCFAVVEYLRRLPLKAIVNAIDSLTERIIEIETGGGSGGNGWTVIVKSPSDQIRTSVADGSTVTTVNMTGTTFAGDDYNRVTAWGWVSSDAAVTVFAEFYDTDAGSPGSIARCQVFVTAEDRWGGGAGESKYWFKLQWEMLTTEWMNLCTTYRYITPDLGIPSDVTVPGFFTANRGSSSSLKNLNLGLRFIVSDASAVSDMTFVLRRVLIETAPASSS